MPSVSATAWASARFCSQASSPGRSRSLLLTSQPGEGTTVTVSLPNRKTAVQELSSFIIDYSGGFNPILLELCDALPKQAFTQKFLD